MFLPKLNETDSLRLLEDPLTMSRIWHRLVGAFQRRLELEELPMALCSPHRCEQVHTEHLRHHKNAVKNVEQWSVMIRACIWLEGCKELHMLSPGTLTAAGYHC